MSDSDKKVPMNEAMEQVQTVGVRLGLLHLAYGRLLMKEFGPQKGKELIIKAMMEYGKLAGQRSKDGHQDLPWYGFHDKYLYDDQEFLDTRHNPKEDFDYARFKVEGCILAKVFKEYDEEELGSLYCYVDPAKSMEADPSHKLIHTACEVCGDGHCAFDSVPTSEEERNQFEKLSTGWKQVDPILVRDDEDSE